MNSKFEKKIDGKNLVVEINEMAEQASGSCFVQYGDTMILATAVMSEYSKEDLGFFPLTVDYEERYYAAGKIRGPRYVKREGRPSDEAVCNARLIDRAIRPLFPANLTREVQVIITVLSWDGENDPDILGLLGASLALSISNIPWQGPVNAVRIGKIDDNFVLNPSYPDREKSKMDLVVSAMIDREILVNMLEGGFEEVKEDDVFSAFQTAKPLLGELLNFQKEIVKKAGKEKFVLPQIPPDLELEKEIKEFLGGRLEKTIFQKKGEGQSLGAMKEELVGFVKARYPEVEKSRYAGNFFEEEVNKIVHEKAIKD